tara:strand:- start:23 stop:265 length:243 start_codon:yes stop_codon:yes gene_type:complete
MADDWIEVTPRLWRRSVGNLTAEVEHNPSRPQPYIARWGKRPRWIGFDHNDTLLAAKSSATRAAKALQPAPQPPPEPEGV